MDAYYSNQIQLPYYSGAARQRGSGLGALAATVGRFALPVFRNVLFPAAKKFTQNLVAEAAPEMINLIDGKTNFKKATKRTLSKATKKSLQRGSGGSSSKPAKKQRKLENLQARQPLIPPPPRSSSGKFTSKKPRVKRSRYDILGNLKQ